jgi:hypothetical protein
LNIHSFFFYAWLHVIALLVLISPLSKKAGDWVRGSSLINLPPGILILTFIGTLAQHLMGGLLYETILGLFVGMAPEVFRFFWNTTFWLYAFERTLTIEVTGTAVGSTRSTLFTLNAVSSIAIATSLPRLSNLK